jgi:hypothetical protein
LLLTVLSQHFGDLLASAVHRLANLMIDELLRRLEGVAEAVEQAVL